jgi:hypothetical protein
MIIDSGICIEQEDALELLKRQGRIIYHPLSGPEHCANRDIIEVSLIARLRPPLNIKSER